LVVLKKRGGENPDKQQITHKCQGGEKSRNAGGATPVTH